jgi:hypothetical protein
MNQILPAINLKTVHATISSYIWVMGFEFEKFGNGNVVCEQEVLGLLESS